jgi:glycosyltransferase involved in cell wall biosynthesis
MRLCVIAGTFHPEAGGPPTYLYHLLPALVERGHSVSVVTYGEADESDPVDYPAEYPAEYPYPVTRLSRRAPIPARLLAFTREVTRQGRGADVLFVSDYGLPAALANLRLRKPMVIKVVSDFAWEFAERHGWTSLPVAEFQSARHGPRVRLLRRVEGWYVSQADRVIVPSEHVGRLVRGWGVDEGKIRVIYNALPSEVGDLPTRAEARERLGWEADEPILVTVGRVAEVKRVDLQLRALARLERGRLAIVGDGPERPGLEALAGELGIAGRVTFTGALPHERALLAIRAADVFLLTSRTEGLSHVLLEAMQLGTPCVASAVGGNPEVIEDGVDGLLVPYGDVEALVAAVESLIDALARCRALAEAARRSVARFSWERLVDSTEALLCEVAGG